MDNDLDSFSPCLRRMIFNVFNFFHPRAKALPRAPEKSLPFAIEDPEGPLEFIPVELSSERLKAYRRPNCAVLVNGTIDVGRIALERRSA
jgi:hypothetical protein